MIAFILLCVAVLIDAGAPPLPYVRWVAFLLALVALILAAIGRAHF